MRHLERRQIAQTLQEYPVFAGCSAEDLDALVAASHDFTLPPTWSLVQQGIPADAFYVILEGTVRVFDGRDEVATLGSGDVFGEMAFVGGGQRRATVSTVTRVSGIRVDYDRLARLVKRRPQLGETIAEVYRSRVAEPVAS